MRRYQRAAYQRGLVLLLEAHEILSVVKVVGWTQHHAINDVFLKIAQALESLAEVAPNDIAPITRQRISRGFD